MQTVSSVFFLFFDWTHLFFRLYLIHAYDSKLIGNSHRIIQGISWFRTDIWGGNYLDSQHDVSVLPYFTEIYAFCCSF